MMIRVFNLKTGELIFSCPCTIVPRIGEQVTYDTITGEVTEVNYDFYNSSPREQGSISLRTVYIYLKHVEEI